MWFWCFLGVCGIYRWSIISWISSTNGVINDKCGKNKNRIFFLRDIRSVSLKNTIHAKYAHGSIHSQNSGPDLANCDVHHAKHNISLIIPDEYRFYSGSTTPTEFFDEGWTQTAPHVQQILPGINQIKHVSSPMFESERMFDANDVFAAESIDNSRSKPHASIDLQCETKKLRIYA